MSCAFDHVFGGHASQEDVFEEVSGFVQSALDGFKVKEEQMRGVPGEGVLDSIYTVVSPWILFNYGRI